MLTRELAHAGHYPAVDVLQSVSRLQTEVVAHEVQEAAQELRRLLAAHRDKRDLIAIGAYERGSDPAADRAIDLGDAIGAFLRQRVDEPTAAEEADARLIDLLASPALDARWRASQSTNPRSRPWMAASPRSRRCTSGSDSRPVRMNSGPQRPKTRP